MGLGALAVEKVFSIPLGLLRIGSAMGGPARTEITASMEPALWDPEPEAGGCLRRVTVRAHGVVTADRFRAIVKVPLPSPGLGIPTEASARTADIRLILSRGGLPYAERRLVFVRVQSEDQAEAEYRLDLRRAPGPHPARTADAPPGAGLPDLHRGDAVTAVLVVDPNDRAKDIEFLSGSVRPGYWR